jgi:hypothetical protein
VLRHCPTCLEEEAVLAEVLVLEVQAALSPAGVGRCAAARVTVILRTQLDNLGYKGEEVTVAAGYARNFLVPTGRAVYATASARAAYRVVLPPRRRAASPRSGR